MNPDVPARMRVVAALAGLLCLGPNIVHAACQSQVGRFVSIGGSVEVQSQDEEAWAVASLETGLCEGDSIRVGDRSRATVALINESVLSIDESTTIRLLDIKSEKGERSWLEAVKGTFQSFSRKPRYLTVNTPYLNGSIEGTEFVVRVEDKSSEITVFEGVVRASNKQGEVAVSPGESARAAAGQAPVRRIVVRPRDQVQWSLYYPPILSGSALASKSPALAEAVSCADRGDTVCAFAALDRVPANAQDAQFYLLRASLLLSVGRVEEAKADIDASLETDPNAGLAYSLRSVIAVAQNDNAAALKDARRGVELDPTSASAKIALSYALQANLQLTEARDTLLKAVDQSPEDALAWARLSELWLMLGERKQSREAAQRAAALQPSLARTQYVLGFAALSEIRLREARAAFERAIALDSADPLPHLGLGLAKIRGGQLVPGTRDIEAAVALDGNSALLRAYLGKAYFEEKRAPLDAQQFAIAQQLDPKDPTAYFYDAIQKQTTNRPVEALQEMQTAIELNDNRAVYRSRLLLDSDRAARGAALANIYTDLEFQQLGLVEGWKSVNTDPGNSAAHRFLADTYAVLPRHEIARVSELLQSQLLDPLNTTPIQPLLGESNLFLISSLGPAAVGFNEFNELFTRNGFTVQASGLVGGNGTGAGQVIVSGLHNKTSFSVGGFDYSTDGFRENADQKDKIANVFVQHQLTPHRYP
jgi:tetratricopeptide (TPR) repeat protein